MLSVSVYVPSESRGQPIDATKRQTALDNVLKDLSRLFGGATAQDGIGAWVNGDGDLVREHVTIAKSYADDNEVIAHWRDVLELGRYVKAYLGQESVLVSQEPVSAVEFV